MPAPCSRIGSVLPTIIPSSDSTYPINKGGSYTTVLLAFVGNNMRSKRDIRVRNDEHIKAIRANRAAGHAKPA